MIWNQNLGSDSHCNRRKEIGLIKLEKEVQLYREMKIDPRRIKISIEEHLRKLQKKDEEERERKMKFESLKLYLE